MKKFLLLLALLPALTFHVYSQGDDCSNALYLNDVTDFCSGNGAYTNAGSTASGYGIATCWNAAATSDVWFSFIAVGTNMLGSVTGSGGSAGTMVSPRVALYGGTCGGTINELACNSGTATVQFYSGSLVIGQTYYIRVSTAIANRGTFKLCANNYTPPSTPGADCSGATKLCDKNTVGVGTFSGPGTNAFETNISGSCMTIENNSVWYKWTCATAGTLTFDITPLNGLNDIDFVLFQIPDINSCTKTILRCNTSSCTPGNGSTGLSATDSDISENPGCDAGENAYCSQITMTAGACYALVIDNANAFDGFNLSFGGTGTFLGAQPVISPVSSPICAGSSIVFDGNSSTNVSGGLNWTFSNGSAATTQTGPGPFTITYPAVGNYIAILEGIDANGCHSSQNVSITVNNGSPVNAGPDINVCAGSPVTLTASGAASYSWNNSVSNGVAFTPSSTQTYTVTGTTGACTSTDQVVVTVNAAPTVNGGADQSVCPGGSVTLTGSGATSYTWNNGVTNGVAFTPSATQTYTVTGTDGNGCTNTDQVLVSVGSGLTVNAGPDQTVCAGQSVTLSGSGATAYSWNNGVTNGASFTPSATQTYTVTGTNASGCTGTDQVLITVNPVPVVNAGADIAVCAGSPVTLSGSGAASYTWNNGVTNGTAFTPLSTQTYTVTGTAAGCTNTDQVVVTVNPLPNVSAGQDRTVCAGQSVTLTGSGAATYTWNNGVTNGTAFTPLATQTYTVTGTAAGGCSNTDQVLVTVNALPVVTVGADQSVCAGGSVTLTATGATTYSWTNGVSNGVSFVPVSTALFTVTGTDANGCVNTDGITVTVNPLPDVTAGSDQTVCLGEQVTLSGSGATSYSWNNGISNNVPFAPSGSQTYTVTGTDANGCVNTASVTVNVLPVPQPVIITTGPLAGSPGLVVGFDNGSSDATSFSWNFGNGQTDVTTDISDGYDITYSQVGTYTITLVADNGYCTATATKTVVITIPPVVVVNVPNVVTPDNDGLNDIFNITALNVESMKIVITNRWGETIKEFDGVLTGWDVKTEKGDEVTSGVYFFTYEIVGLDGSEISGHGFVHVVR